MAFKDILVQVDAATPPGCCAIALELAARWAGRVTGLYPKAYLITELEDAAATGASPPVDLGLRIRDRLQQEDENAAAAAALLRRLAAPSNVDCDFRVVNGDTAHDIIVEARRADLVVVGPWDPSHRSHAFAVDIALGASVPVLVVPANVDQTRLGARVLVAWNGSRESSSALRNALPLLTRDAVLEIRTAQYKHDRTNAAALQRYLERHDCRFNFKVVDDNGQSIPRWLLGEAVDTGCDLLVMGVYGHAREQGLVLSDVSRFMLQNAPLPRLISG